MAERRSTAYAGEVSATEAWNALAAEPTAVLVDVRTRAEWQYVGIPSLQELGKLPVLVEWESFPDSVIDTSSFVRRLEAELASRGVGKDVSLFFICRSGSRSRHAAVAMTEAGFTRCFNVAPGFEGSLDEERHRGQLGGWKVEGLPWTQT